MHWSHGLMNRFWTLKTNSIALKASRHSSRQADTGMTKHFMNGNSHNFFANTRWIISTRQCYFGTLQLSYGKGQRLFVKIYQSVNILVTHSLFMLIIIHNIVVLMTKIELIFNKSKRRAQIQLQYLLTLIKIFRWSSSPKSYFHKMCSSSRQ